MTTDPRITCLEKSVRQLKLTLLVAGISVVACVTIAAAPEAEKVVTADKIIVGGLPGSGQPSVVISANGTETGIALLDTKGRTRAMLGFVEKSGAAMFHIESETGAAVALHAAGAANGNIAAGETSLKMTHPGGSKPAIFMATHPDPNGYGFAIFTKPDGSGGVGVGYNGPRLLLDKSEKKP